MDKQNEANKESCAAAPARDVMADPQLRVVCLNLAVHLGEGTAHATVAAAEKYLNFVAGGPANPPMRRASPAGSYQQRVSNEKDELDVRLAGLIAFLESTRVEELAPDERERMQSQAKVMQEYSDILGERIAHFPKGGA